MINQLPYEIENLLLLIKESSCERFPDHESDLQNIGMSNLAFYALSPCLISPEKWGIHISHPQINKNLRKKDRKNTPKYPKSVGYGYSIFEDRPYEWTIMDRKEIDAFLDRRKPLTTIQKHRRKIVVNFLISPPPGERKSFNRR